MANAEHTPGPWTFLEEGYGEEAVGSLTVCDSAHNDLCSVYSRDDATVDIPREQAIANARLIAAAPDLLAALEQIDTLAVCTGVVDPKQHENMLTNIARIARLEADLKECREFIEDYVDVNDGDYGEPAPNRAMTLVSMIDETLNGRPY